MSFVAGHAFAEAHELSFDVLIALVALHVVSVLFYLLYDRNNLVSAISGRRKRIGGEPTGMVPAPAWRLWTGVALATFVVWFIVG